MEVGGREELGFGEDVRVAYEKPYRSTGLSWQLQFERAAEDEDSEGEIAVLTAFRQELAEAGDDSIAELTRCNLHFDGDALALFTERFVELIDEYQANDAARRQEGAPGYGGIVVVHRLADSPGQAAPEAAHRNGSGDRHPAP